MRVISAQIEECDILMDRVNHLNANIDKLKVELMAEKEQRKVIKPYVEPGTEE